MDEIHLEIRLVEGLSNEFFTYREVVYLINGKNLRDDIAALQIQAIKAKSPLSHPDWVPIVHSWVGITPNQLHQYEYAIVGGKPITEDDLIGYDSEDPNEMIIYGCGGCADTGCSALSIRIEVQQNLVVWSGMRDTQRDIGSYDALGPFKFDRKQYEAEFARILSESNFDES